MSAVKTEIDAVVEDGMREYHATLASLRAQVKEGEERLLQVGMDWSAKYDREHDEATRRGAEVAMLKDQVEAYRRRCAEMDAILAEAQTHLSCFAAMAISGLEKMKLGKLRTATSVRASEGEQLPIKDQLTEVLRRAGGDDGDGSNLPPLPKSFAPPRPRIASSSS